MKTAYFTFGQCHEHVLPGFPIKLDKDIVVKITAPDPRFVMFSVFGTKWAFDYTVRPDMSFYPNGIVSLDEYGNYVESNDCKVVCSAREERNR